MSYWSCARLEPRREAVAQHFLKLAGYEVYIPQVREQRLRRSRRGSRLIHSLKVSSLADGSPRDRSRAPARA
jgi:hypothetical protein